MRRKLHKYGFILLLGTLVAACSKVPDGILSEKRMQAIQVDMQLAEAMISGNYKNFPDDLHKEALYESVFKKHKTTQAEYDSSLVWYGRNLDIYMKVYDRVYAELDKRLKDMGDIQADAINTTRNDSIDIWPRRTSLTLTTDALFNGVTFDINPETRYSSGSSFVLGMNVWGLNKNMHDFPEVHLSADQGDTIVSVSNQIRKDGYIETILKSVPTKQINRVYGYIRLNNSDPYSYHKIYIDSLNLMKYNYGRLTEANDSIPK